MYPGSHKHIPLVWLHLLLFLQRQVFAQPAPKVPTGHSSWHLVTAGDSVIHVTFFLEVSDETSYLVQGLVRATERVICFQPNHQSFILCLTPAYCLCSINNNSSHRSPVYPGLHTHCPVDDTHKPLLWHWHSCEQLRPNVPGGHGWPHTVPCTQYTTCYVLLGCLRWE